MTPRWEYRTVNITFDKRNRRDWVVEGPVELAPNSLHGPAPVGFTAILEAYGSCGWELISLILERSTVVVGFGAYHIEPRSYRATFGRQTQAPD